MGQRRKSLRDLIKENYDSMLGIGRNKHQDKRDNISSKYIYSWDTYRSYLKQSFYFADWVKKQPAREEVGHKARTLEEARPFVEKWLQENIDKGLSTYTIKLQASALAKLYHCKTTDFDIETPSRSRVGVTRSRGPKVRDKDFNENRHSEMVNFCRCTGLRRAELSQITGNALREIDGKYYLEITKGTKGGRPRTSPIVGSEEEVKAVIDQLKAAGSNRLYPRVSTHADIHSYRADYATRVYEANKRPVSDFSHERLIIFRNRVIEAYKANIHYKPDRISFSKYYDKTKTDQYGQPKMLPGYKDVSSVYACRRDLATVIYDRRALFAASQALGHNRECVVAEHYIRV